MELNKDLLLKIKQVILDEPKGFQMGGYKKSKQASPVCRDYGLAWDFPRCGTALCIAGYALQLSGKDLDGEENVTLVARELLNVDDNDLFYVDRWPEDLYKRFLDATTPEERALIGAERIDRFLLEAGA